MADADQLEQAKQQHDQQQAMEERKQMMLQSYLTVEAKERLARIAIVKPDKADEVSSMILSMAQGGRLQEKISETRLKQMIESLEQAKKPAKITFLRKRAGDESDEDYDL